MITVYSKNHCPFCDQAKALLTKWEIPFDEVKIDQDTGARDFIVGEGGITFNIFSYPSAILQYALAIFNIPS